MAYLAVASASGFRVRPAEVAAALTTIPGFGIRRLEREGRRQKGEPREVIESALATDARIVSFDLIGSEPESWCHLSATKSQVGQLNEVDLLVVNWRSPLDAAAVASFAALCEACCAEFGCLDDRDPFPGFKWYWDIPMGLPGIAWTMWFGPQLSSFLPPGAVERCWPVAEHRPAGHLVMLDRAPPPQAATAREAVAACLGAEVFAPRKTPWPLDTSTKNTITPDWVTKGVPPELPLGMRIVGFVPKKGDGSE